MGFETDKSIDKRCLALQEWRYQLTYPTNNPLNLPDEHQGLVLLAGSGNRLLSWEVGHLLGIKPQFNASRHNNGEVNIKIENTVRCRTALILVSAGREDVNGYAFEIFGLADAARRAGASEIVCIAPYMPYCRQDKQNDGREPLLAQKVAQFIQDSGVSHIITVDLHSPAVKGAVDIPWDDVYGSFSTHQVIKQEIESNLDNTVAVAPDEGSVKRNRKQAELLGIRQGGVLHKFRDKTQENNPKVTMMSGDVRGCRVVMFDDMIDTGGTAKEDIEFLMNQAQAESVLFVATHPVFSNQALEKISDSLAYKFIVTNSLALPEGVLKTTKLTIVSIAQLLAETSLRITSKGRYQVSDLFP